MSSGCGQSRTPRRPRILSRSVSLAAENWNRVSVQKRNGKNWKGSPCREFTERALGGGSISRFHRASGDRGTIAISGELCSSSGCRLTAMTEIRGRGTIGFESERYNRRRDSSIVSSLSNNERRSSDISPIYFRECMR